MVKTGFSRLHFENHVHPNHSADGKQSRQGRAMTRMLSSAPIVGAADTALCAPERAVLEKQVQQR